MINFDQDDFINRCVTKRTSSLFQSDLANNHHLLTDEIDNKSVLVIGGAGTIGSSFIKALLKFKPAKLYVVDINENGLTELMRDLRSSLDCNIPQDMKTYPINFYDEVFEKIIRNEGPFHIVANFAAHKHVRSEKDSYSIEAMINNNLLKAKKLLDLLVEIPPKHFFCVSTDKAANPVNIMGASKKLMEELILAYSNKIPITTARFANVAFSNGSLPFGFINRLLKKQPLSSPSDIKRYFVSPEESGQICLLACILGDSGDIFFPKLDASLDMVRFSTIAIDLLAEFDLKPKYCNSESEAKMLASKWDNSSKEYPVYFFKSDTSGEKPFEEFYTDDESVEKNLYTSLGVIKSTKKKDLDHLNQTILKIENLFQDPTLDKSKIVDLLNEIIPNFKHIETGKNLDQRM
jgi:FlaA1/EpsC-like NDP-sugar epimerase